jgi:hypothetical protein
MDAEGKSKKIQELFDTYAILVICIYRYDLTRAYDPYPLPTNLLGGLEAEDDLRLAHLV